MGDSEFSPFPPEFVADPHPHQSPIELSVRTRFVDLALPCVGRNEWRAALRDFTALPVTS